MLILDEKSGSNYVVQFKNEQGKVLFHYETQDYDLALRLRTMSWKLNEVWKLERPKQTGPHSWHTFALVADAMGYPTRTGGHAIIFAEIEQCVFLNKS